MSQKKVNEYKAKKKNRVIENNKKKTRKLLIKIVTAICCAVVVFWVGISIYTKYENAKPREMYDIDVSDINEYNTELQQNN